MNIIVNTTAAAARSFVTAKVTTDFDPELFNRANRLGAAALDDPRGPEAHLRDAFHANEVVFAIYPHPTQPGAFTSEVIGGAGKMARIYRGAVLDVQFAAWHCQSAEEARQVRAAFSKDTHYDRERLRKVQTPNHRLVISETPDTDPVPQALWDLVPEANANLERLKLHQAGGGETGEWYRELFEAHDRVVLMFRDPESRTQMGCIVAKDTEIGEPARPTAMITSNRAQAVEMRDVLGNTPAVRS